MAAYNSCLPWLQTARLRQQPQTHRRMTSSQSAGFALPMAVILGMVMLAIGGASVLVAQNARKDAVQRRAAGASILVSDGAVSRALVQLNAPNNGVLLNRNYDPINPKTGRTFLGADGLPNSGDEGTTALDQWTGYDPSSQPCFQQLGWSAPTLARTGTLGSNTSYTLQAYRYDATQRLGTVLLEGNYQGQTSTVLITLSIEPVLDDFPGLMVTKPNPASVQKVGILALRGRVLLGRKANVYYVPESSTDPTLTGYSAPGDATRPNYLNAIWSSSSQDGASGDTVNGKLFACQLSPSIPMGTPGTDLGTITTNLTLRGTGGTVPTAYRIRKIDLSGSEVLTFDTTNGPIQVELLNDGSFIGIVLRDKAKILNVRTDGKPPQVGDLRILSRQDTRIDLYDESCIQNAFLWSRIDELRLLTTKPGCPGGNNTNFEGVVWVESILSSKNAATNRDVKYLGFTGGNYDTTVTPGATSGIAVPDDVTSLVDLLNYVDWPIRYRYGEIKRWQRMN